jgi:hypothetical protein
MRRVAPVTWLIDAGVIAATLSSALASFLGAPRILQSLASHRIFPGLTWFARGTAPANHPRRGVLLSGAIGLAGIALGDLNLIAPVVSMFFLISYGLLNYATYAEASAKSPGFRPRFRWFDPRISLAGWIACGGAAIATSPTAGAFALAYLMGRDEAWKGGTIRGLAAAQGDESVAVALRDLHQVLAEVRIDAQAAKAAEEANRRALKAHAKADQADSEAATLTDPPTKDAAAE